MPSPTSSPTYKRQRKRLPKRDVPFDEIVHGFSAELVKKVLTDLGRPWNSAKSTSKQKFQRYSLSYDETTKTHSWQYHTTDQWAHSRDQKKKGSKQLEHHLSSSLATMPAKKSAPTKKSKSPCAWRKTSLTCGSNPSCKWKPTDKTCYTQRQKSPIQGPTNKPYRKKSGKVYKSEWMRLSQTALMQPKPPKTIKYTRSKSKKATTYDFRLKHPMTGKPYYKARTA